ncbi:MAG: N,N-dimethylformamidase beta subunit family domain-containing protein, partial [Acidimicrobiales bacterium]
TGVGIGGWASRGKLIEMRELSRRDFLLGVGAAAALGIAGAGALVAESGSSKPRRTGSASTANTAAQVGATRIGDGPVVQTAAWVTAENARAGTNQWAIEGNAIPHVIEAYADQVSAQVGDTVKLFVSCQDPTFTVAAYRMGWYNGLGGRLIWRSPAGLTGRVQPAPSLNPSTYMVECAWAPSLSVKVGLDWPPGDYLFKLSTSSGQARWVPFVVRDDSSKAAYVIQNSVTTWQAYNWWGGYCLYYGPNSAGSIYTGPHGSAGEAFTNRSRVVSFDRPYPHDWAYGASDFIGNELPMVMLAERLGLDVTYWTDLDFHQRPQLLAQHRALISLGHDEYWSAPMYDAAIAGNNNGVNFMFLGANACFRHVRFDASPLGVDRRMVCYKVASEDPLYGVDNSQVTGNWADPPMPRPESVLVGSMYQSNGVDADMVIVDPASWVLAGTGLGSGHRLAGLIGPEYDGYDPAIPSPSNLSVIAHSPVVDIAGSPGYADMTWFTRAKAGGVFATGTNYWISRLGDNSGRFNVGLVSTPTELTAPLTRITENVLGACGTGPAGLTHPSVANWQSFYRGPGTSSAIATNYRTYWGAGG